MREKKNRPCVRKVNKPKDRKDSRVCLEDSETQTWANAKVCAPLQPASLTNILASFADQCTSASWFFYTHAQHSTVRLTVAHASGSPWWVLKSLPDFSYWKPLKGITLGLWFVGPLDDYQTKLHICDCYWYYRIVLWTTLPSLSYESAYLPHCQHSLLASLEH